MEFILKDNNKITVRDAIEKDAKDLLIYIHKVNAESKNLMREPKEFTMTIKQEKEFIKGTFDSSNACFIIALDDDLVISSAGFSGKSLSRVKHRVSLGISVLNSYQGLGVGTIMMNILIAKAKELKKSKIDLEVRVDNVRAIRLYEKLGFIKEGIIKNGFFVEDKYVDLLIMGKLL